MLTSCGNVCKGYVNFVLLNHLKKKNKPGKENDSYKTKPIFNNL